MKLLRRIVLAIPFCVVLLIGTYVSCSQSPGISTPAIIDATKDQTAETRDASGGGRTGILGEWSVAIYPERNVVDITPRRTADYSINILPFLHGPGGALTGLEISILEYENLGITGECKIGVTLKHPYPDATEFCGFDVMGLFMTSGSKTGVQDTNLVYPQTGEDPALLNPDGYTRWMNRTEFPDDAPWGFFDPMSDENSGFIANSTLSAYKYFADDLAAEDAVSDFYADPANCDNRGLFRNGSENTRNYDIRFPIKEGEPQIFFNYVVLASWEEAVPSPPINIPDDFPQIANAQFPFYASVDDYSTLFYLDDSTKGGDLLLDIDLYDWSNKSNPNAIKSKIKRVFVESEGGLLEDDHWEASSGGLLFMPGKSPISTRVLLNIPGKPYASGLASFLVGIEIEGGYDQGYGGTFPEGNQAIYLRVDTEVSSCPGSLIGGISLLKASSGQSAVGVDFFGSGFIEGPELGVTIINTTTGQVLHGLDPQYFDGGHIRSTFDLTDIIPGVFNIICTNGCGTESTPPSNLLGWDGKFKVVGSLVENVSASTGRTAAEASSVNSLAISWPATDFVQYYRVYLDSTPDPTSPMSMTNNLQLLAETTATSYVHTSGSSVPFNNHSNYVYVIRSYYDIGSGNGESDNSNLVYYSGQDFDGSTTNGWNVTAQNYSYVTWKFAAYGFTGKGLYMESDLLVAPLTPVWIVLNSSRIPKIGGASNIRLEFNHRSENYSNGDGYFAGYATQGLPPSNLSTVPGMTPVPSAAVGYNYNASSSMILKNAFLLPTPYLGYYSNSGLGWTPWSFSAFDAPDALTVVGPSNMTVNIAFLGMSKHKFNLDDCALIVY